MTDCDIRLAGEADRDAVWTIWHEVVRREDTYGFSARTDKNEALSAWIDQPTACFVAERAGEVVGTYYIKPNREGRGDHVCNAGFMVSERARGGGIGRLMGLHALDQGSRLGFRAMQFNFVVSTNARAVHLWQRLAFEIVGTLPDAFRHPQHGFVDAYVMYRQLPSAEHHHG